MRLRLLDPDEFLDSHAGLARLLFSLPSLVLMSMILAAGATAAVLDWPAVAAYWTVRGLAAHSFVLLPLVYLVMKTVHELAHALAVKRWGGEVHEMGIVLLLLMPFPYVDASSAWAFADKYRRMLVGAAGKLAELVLAAIAMLLFFVVEEGLVKDFAYTAMLLGTVSTLLFNGNPLLRFDGYYVLADAIEIPNLAPRASRYWAYRAQRYAFGIKDAQSPVAARGERLWLAGYAAGATLYRIAIVGRGRAGAGDCARGLGTPRPDGLAAGALPALRGPRAAARRAPAPSAGGLGRGARAQRHLDGRRANATDHERRRRRLVARERARACGCRRHRHRAPVR